MTPIPPQQWMIKNICMCVFICACVTWTGCEFWFGKEMSRWSKCIKAKSRFRNQHNDIKFSKEYTRVNRFTNCDRNSSASDLVTFRVFWRKHCCALRMYFLAVSFFFIFEKYYPFTLRHILWYTFFLILKSYMWF